MRDPAREELRRVERRARPVEDEAVGDETAGVEDARGMVDRHQRDDGAARPVEGRETRRSEAGPRHLARAVIDGQRAAPA